MPRQHAKQEAAEFAKEQMLNMLVTPRTQRELAAELGLAYKTINRYCNALRDRGEIKSIGVREREILWARSERTIIPHIINSAGATSSAITMLHFWKKFGIEAKSQLEQQLESWPRAFIGLFELAERVRRNGVVDEELRKEIETYFRQLRASLHLRADIINNIMNDPRWWEEEHLRDFQEDKLYNPELIQEMWRKATIKPQPPVVPESSNPSNNSGGN